ncbi:hypothetical protein [Companilactobacillus sp. DQM5]|uniref:hypothetical protein n=1 Tax=Companilactobacillus sp. DQM5 TaxID=3463359 RepID=UPI004059581F
MSVIDIKGMKMFFEKQQITAIGNVQVTKKEESKYNHRRDVNSKTDDISAEIIRITKTVDQVIKGKFSDGVQESIIKKNTDIKKI